MTPYTISFSVTSTTPGFKFNGQPLTQLTTYIFNDVPLRDEVPPKEAAKELFEGVGVYEGLIVAFYG